MSDAKILEYKKLVEKTKEIFNEFPKEKRFEVLFDQWSLKDIVAHFNHWAQHDLNCLEALKQSKEPYWAPDINDFNKKGVKIRADRNWEEVYEEFVKLLNQVFSEFETLPENLWYRRFWKDRKFTPSLFLEIDINHYKNEHLSELEKQLKLALEN